MKINGEGVNIFEEEKESVLDETISKFFVIKKYMQENKLPPHERNYIRFFFDMYKIEIDVEEMIEIRSFAEEDYADWKRSRIMDDYQRNGSIVDLRGMGLE